MTDKEVPYTRMDACNRFLETVKHSMELGLEMVDVFEDRCQVRMPWQEKLVGNPETGVVHGGAIFALMDQAGGLSNACVLYPDFEMTPTIDMRVDHLRAPASGETVICDARCYRVSQYVLFVRMTVFGEHDPDELLATGMATYMRMKMPRRGRKSNG